MKYLTNYKFKLKPFKHQLEHFVRCKDEKFHGLLWDMGTGKTKQFLDVGCYLYEKGEIEAMVIIAPNGVHIAHISEAVPMHVPERIRKYACFYSSKMRKKEKQEFEEARKVKGFFKIIAFNPDSLKTKYAYDYLVDFLKAYKTFMVIDEFMDFKNPTSQRSKKLLKLRHLPKYKYICDGTPINQSPTDVFVGYQFLSDGFLGFNTFLSFKNRYVVLENKQFLREMSYALRKRYELKEADRLAEIIYNERKQKYLSHVFLTNIIEEKLISRILQISRKAYWIPCGVKNLGELKENIYKCSSRVNKGTCLDLPDKLYQELRYDLDDETLRIYNNLKEELYHQFNSEQEITTQNVLTQYLRLQQILGGQLKLDTGEIKEISPLRFNILLGNLERQPQKRKTVIWCRFKYEIEKIKRLLSEKWGRDSVVTYYGETDKETKIENKKTFMESATCRFFVSNPKAGGVGVDGLQVANYEYFFSRDFSLRFNKQAEDRLHRAGQRKNVFVISIIANNTIDEKIKRSLDNNQSVLDAIINDKTFLLR